MEDSRAEVRRIVAKKPALVEFCGYIAAECRRAEDGHLFANDCGEGAGQVVGMLLRQSLSFKLGRVL